MAKKIILHFPFECIVINGVTRETADNIQGYECGFLAVFQSPVSKRWRVCHKHNYSPTQGEFFKGWKQKRQALAFAEEIQKHGLQFDVEDANEFALRNNRDLIVAAYIAAMKIANEKETKE